MGQESSDDALVARACEGDRSAFRLLVERHLPAVHRILSRAVGDPETAADLAQETFLRAWQRMHRYEPQGRYRGWIIRIALNLLRSHLRREKLRRLLLLRGRENLPPALTGLGTDAGPDALAAVRDARRMLAQLLATLPPRYREPFLLKHLEELTYEEISEILGVSRGALKVRVHRARERLAAEARRLGLKPLLDSTRSMDGDRRADEH